MARENWTYTATVEVDSDFMLSDVSYKTKANTKTNYLFSCL